MSAFSSFEWRELWVGGQGGCGRLAVQPRGAPASAPGSHPPPPTYVFPERIQEEGLELSEALIDARSAPLLHDRLGGLRGGPWLGPQSVHPRRAPPSPPRAHPPRRAPIPVARPPAHTPPGPTFRGSTALRGLLGVRLALAGAPASGEALGFPGASAGMARRRGPRAGWRARGAPRPHPAGPRRQARARRRPPGYLRKRRRGVCEPGAAFFPTLAPANEQLRSARAPPPGARPPAPGSCQSRAGPGPAGPRGRQRRAGAPCTSGGLRRDEAGNCRAASASASALRAARPGVGRGGSPAGWAGPRAAWGAQPTAGGAGNPRKNSRGDGVGRPQAGPLPGLGPPAPPSI